VSSAQRTALAAVALCTLVVPSDACELVLSEHRAARELMRLPLSAQRPRFQIAFEHSVLGTTVTDHYEMRAHDDGTWRAHLVEERFSGDGYGLPYAATAPGERLVRDGDGWRLMLDRLVHPLVLLAPAAQRLRLDTGEVQVLLAGLSLQSIAVRADGCVSH
jgi:hypothetical protein